MTTRTDKALRLLCGFAWGTAVAALIDYFVGGTWTSINTAFLVGGGVPGLITASILVRRKG